MGMSLVLIAAGMFLLIGGAESLVRGAARLALAFRIPPLVVGLTVVAFSTSSPELAVCANAAATGQPEIAVGNVVGSCILNVLFILGLSAMIMPLEVSRRVLRVDLLVMIGVAALLLVLSLDGMVSRGDGALLCAGIVAYTILQVILARREAEPGGGGAAPPGRASAVTVNLLLVAGGLALLVLGSRWLVEGAVAVARHFGVSDLVVGLTVVTAGTTMPEAVTAVIASMRGQRDLAVGNVVGSNIFNVLAVMGIAAVASGSGVPVSPAAIRFDMPVMVVVAAACLPVFFNSYRITRWEGAMFFFYYVAYTTYVVLGAAHHDSLPAFSGVMLYFVIPLTVAILAVVTARSVRRISRAADTG